MLWQQTQDLWIKEQTICPFITQDISAPTPYAPTPHRIRARCSSLCVLGLYHIRGTPTPSNYETQDLNEKAAHPSLQREAFILESKEILSE